MDTEMCYVVIVRDSGGLLVWHMVYGRAYSLRLQKGKRRENLIKEYETPKKRLSDSWKIGLGIELCKLF